MRGVSDRIFGLAVALDMLEHRAMWIRTMFHYDVGFSDEELTTFRVRFFLRTRLSSAPYGVQLRRLLRRERMRMPARLLLKYGRYPARWRDAVEYLGTQVLHRQPWAGFRSRDDAG